MDKSTENNESHKSMNGEIIDDDFEKQQDKSQRSGFLWTSLKFIGCVFLGIGLTVSHYVCDILAAVFGTIARTIIGCVKLYKKNKPEGFWKHVCCGLKSLLLVVYNLIKLAFLLLYRATFGLIEHTCGIIKPLYYVFKGEQIDGKIEISDPFSDDKTLKEIEMDNKTCLVRFAIAKLDFKSFLNEWIEKLAGQESWFLKICGKIKGGFLWFMGFLFLPSVKIETSGSLLPKNKGDIENILHPSLSCLEGCLEDYDCF